MALLNTLSCKPGMNSRHRMSRNEQIARNGLKKGEGLNEDRRVRRTREALHKALISLVLERGYEAVTIKDVVDRADVGRSTFYAHYLSKDDLLTVEMADLRTLLVARQNEALARYGGASDRSLGFSRVLFEHAADYRDIYRALVGERGAAIMISRMRAVLTDLVRRDLSEIATQGDQGDVPRSALVHFVVGALMSILTWWLDGTSTLVAVQVDTLFRRLTLPAIEAAAGTPTL